MFQAEKHRARIEKYLREGRTVSGGSTSGYIGPYSPDYYADSGTGDGVKPIIPPEVYNIDLAGQFGAFPGGDITSGQTYAADPAGMSSISTNSAINPNPTGGWMTTLSSVLNAATKGFQAYESGSPSVAVPPVRKATTPSWYAPATPGAGLGPFSWTAIAIIAVGVVGLVVVAKMA